MSNEWSVTVASGDEAAARHLARHPVAWMVVGVLLWVFASGVMLFIARSALVARLVAICWATVWALGHVVMCWRLRERALRTHNPNKTILRRITATPRAYMRWGWGRRVGLQGDTALRILLAMALFISADLVWMFWVGMLFAGEVASASELLLLSLGCAIFIAPPYVAAGWALDSARGQLAQAVQEERTIAHIADAMQAQGGELSMPSAAFAGELSMVLAEQRGGLEVHEAATASEGVVFASQAERADASHDAADEAHAHTVATPNRSARG